MLFKTKRGKKYTSRDIVSFSALKSCANTDLNRFFSILKVRESLLFSADCFEENYEEKIHFENVKLENCEQSALLDRVDKASVISTVINYKKQKSKYSILDKEEYFVDIKLSDGSEVFAPIQLDNEILSEFYKLAKKYKQNG